MLHADEIVSVRRHDFNADSACSGDLSSDSVLQEQLHEILRREYETYEHDVNDEAADEHLLAGIKDHDHRLINNDENEYEFRLFAKPQAGDTISRNHHPTTRRIAIKSPTPEYGESGFLEPRRHESYYFSGDQDESKKSKFAAAAVSGQDVIAMSNMRWKGAELQWRVTVMKENNRNPVQSGRQSARVDRTTGKRSGKKRRILIRKKIQNQKVRTDMANRSQAEKEIAEKEKRTRKNREKKVKRKQKEKTKKIEAKDTSVG